MRLGLSALRARAEAARALLASCTACAHTCGVDRRRGPAGACRMDAGLHVAGYGLHFGEEPCLVGTGGSGMVLLAGCNLACIYCETASFSLLGKDDHLVTEGELASILLLLEQKGAENVHFVTPTPQAPQLLGALATAAARGLSVPVVYNCGGYESVEMLRLLEGVVDIYLPDAKYGDATAGRAYSGCADYPRALEAALAEMYRQVGPLELDERGVARRGLLVRHLVLPGGPDIEALRIVARAAPGAQVNVMAQYRPCHEALLHPALARRPTPAEVEAARAAARRVGLVQIRLSPR